MAKDKLDVFLSSDQAEFENERIRVSKIISDIPFLECTPLENQGAAARDVLEQSLRGVKNSDIYVGVFGKEYSDTTISEYREAVKLLKPCLTYVKSVKREPKLQKFIDEELKTRFKFYPFKGKEQLYQQVKVDLENFILETLKDGLDTRKGKKDETKKLVKMEKMAIPSKNTSDLITQAAAALNDGFYLESLVKTSLAIESTLRNELMNRNINVGNKPLGLLLREAETQKILGKDEINKLQEIQYSRNLALHRGETPNKAKMVWIINNAKMILECLNRN
jgi:hypothetical protein